MNILVTGIGGPTPRSIVRSLVEFSSIHIDNIVVADTNRLALGLYQQGVTASYLVPKADASDYWSKMQEIVESHQIDFAIVQPEVEIISWCKRKKQSELPCLALIPDLELAEVLYDKGHMYELLSGTGLVPLSATIDQSTSYDNVVEKLGSPFWIRSTTGSSGLGSLLIKDADEFTGWINVNSKIREFQAASHLPGRNYACKVLYNEGKLVRAACGERVEYIMSKVVPSGITGNTSFGRLLNRPDLVELADIAIDKAAHKTNSSKHGFFTVDFKEDKEGSPKITEINLRHVAFTQCFASAGANLSADMVKMLMSDEAFDLDYKYYKFEEGMIFLRDVDNCPIVMSERDLLTDE